MLEKQRKQQDLTEPKTISKTTLEDRRKQRVSPNQGDSQRQSRNMQSEENRQLPRGSYTQIMVNPTQLSDKKFAAWMERLVEAREIGRKTD